MQQIKDLIKLPEKSNAKSEWSDLIGFFVENLRDSKGKKYSPVFISMKLAHLKNDYSAIYYLKKRCEKAENFSKCFFGSLKCKT